MCARLGGDRPFPTKITTANENTILIEEYTDGRFGISVTSADGMTMLKEMVPEANRQRVLSVATVELAILESNPPQLFIKALGKTRALGWIKPSLEMFLGPLPPEDGLYHFNFTAVEPVGIVPQVISDIEATTLLAPMPQELKGVVVHAEENEIAEML